MKKYLLIILSILLIACTDVQEEESFEKYKAIKFDEGKEVLIIYEEELDVNQRANVINALYYYDISFKYEGQELYVEKSYYTDAERKEVLWNIITKSQDVRWMKEHVYSALVR